MEYHSEITNILETMSPATARIAIKLGKRRDQLRHCTNVYPPFSDGSIIDSLEEHGLGSTCQYGRLFFYDCDKVKLQSKSINQMIEVDETTSTDMGAMVEGFLAMAAEMRRFVSVQNESINTLVNRNGDMMVRLFDSKEETMVERNAALAMDLELQHFTAENENSYKAQATQAVVNLATTAMEHYQKPISPDDIIELIIKNPDIIDNALENETLTKLISKKLTDKALSQ